MNPHCQTSHLVLATYLLSITIATGVAAVIADVTNYDDLDFEPPEDNPLSALVKRDDGIIIHDPFRIGRELDTRDAQDLVLSLPRNSLHYGLIGPAINSASSRNRARYHLKNPMSKRQRITVPQLAQLLNSMKTRDVNGEGVKLETLRFGKK